MLANLAVGCLSLFLESSLKVMEVYTAAFFVFSGYLIPLELFPPVVRAIADYLPFRYQIGLPVELLTRAYDHDRALGLSMIGRQYGMVVAMGILTANLWRRGLRRFAAYGG